MSKWRLSASGKDLNPFASILRYTVSDLDNTSERYVPPDSLGSDQLVLNRFVYCRSGRPVTAARRLLVHDPLFSISYDSGQRAIPDAA